MGETECFGCGRAVPCRAVVRTAWTSRNQSSHKQSNQPPPSTRDGFFDRFARTHALPHTVAVPGQRQHKGGNGNQRGWYTRLWYTHVGDTGKSRVQDRVGSK